MTVLPDRKFSTIGTIGAMALLMNFLSGVAVGSILGICRERGQGSGQNGDRSEFSKECHLRISIFERGFWGPGDGE
ncbi:MAG: hypothetical protein KGH75_05370 [Rhodospirillales bacterium]|nr:hypothetical protein [Rhodospirillales bacterium]